MTTEAKEQIKTVIDNGGEELTPQEYIQRVSKQTFNLLRIINYSSQQAKRHKEVYLVMLQDAINNGLMFEFILGIYEGLVLFVDAPNFHNKMGLEYYQKQLLPSVNKFVEEVLSP